jgi:hypothetical protein
MARYQAAEAVLSPKGRGSAVIKRKSLDDVSPRVSKEDTVTVFTDPKTGKESEETYRQAREYAAELQRETRGKKAGGVIKSASKRADGIAQRGKTKGRMI